ncbi:DUF2809 domain-containing protein [Microbacterium oleivorans]|nr:DUF2809 domain-containing protein [Microbacterium oleivorans]
MTSPDADADADADVRASDDRAATRHADPAAGWVGDRRRAFRRRLVALVGAGMTIAAGLLVHRVLPDTAASDIAGDALYALLVYLLVIAVAPRLRIRLAAAIGAAWCVAVELLQLTGLPASAGASFPPAMLVLGTVFDPRDLVVYLVTIGFAAGTDAALRRIRTDRALTARSAR